MRRTAVRPGRAKSQDDKRDYGQRNYKQEHDGIEARQYFVMARLHDQIEHERNVITQEEQTFPAGNSIADKEYR